MTKIVKRIDDIAAILFEEGLREAAKNDLKGIEHCELKYRIYRGKGVLSSLEYAIRETMSKLSGRDFTKVDIKTKDSYELLKEIVNIKRKYIAGLEEAEIKMGCGIQLKYSYIDATLEIHFPESLPCIIRDGMSITGLKCIYNTLPRTSSYCELFLVDKEDIFKAAKMYYKIYEKIPKQRL